MDPQASLDQQWAEARDWAMAMPMAALFQLKIACCEPEPDYLLAMMQADPKVGDCIQRLANLAISEALFRALEHEPEDTNTEPSE